LSSLRPQVSTDSFTFDNGPEFARHQKIAQQLGVDIYFAHPYSANNRARNENMNGLLRQTCPRRRASKTLPDNASTAAYEH